jgi:hypothetical protein
MAQPLTFLVPWLLMVVTVAEAVAETLAPMLQIHTLVTAVQEVQEIAEHL